MCVKLIKQQQYDNEYKVSIQKFKTICVCVCVYISIVSAMLFTKVHTYGISLSVHEKTEDENVYIRNYYYLAVINRGLPFICSTRKQTCWVL